VAIAGGLRTNQWAPLSSLRYQGREEDDRSIPRTRPRLIMPGSDGRAESNGHLMNACAHRSEPADMKTIYGGIAQQTVVPTGQWSSPACKAQRAQ